jgi:hypothetical protein
MHEIPPWIFIALIVIVAVGVALQAGVLLGMFIGLRKALRRVDEVTKLAEEHVIPTMASAKILLQEISPKLKVAAQNMVVVSERAVVISQHAAIVSEQAASISQTFREKSEEVGATLDDLLQKTEVQASRVDEMVTGTLDTIAFATAAFQRAVSGPARQVGAVLNGLRAGLGALRSRDPESHAAADGDHFV